MAWLPLRRLHSCHRCRAQPQYSSDVQIKKPAHQHPVKGASSALHTMQKRLRCEAAPVREALLCPLCKDLLKEATTATECCHTFCRMCLDEHITVGGRNNFCPTCKVILGPDPYVHRKLEYDTILDDLVRNIFPRAGDDDRMKARQERETEIREARAAMGLPSRVNVSSSVKRQLEESQWAPQMGSSARTSQKKRLLSGRRTDSASQEDTAHVVLAIPASGDIDEAAAALRLERPYLRISGLMAVKSLCKYIAVELGHGEEEVELHCSGQKLDMEQTVSDIMHPMWVESQINPVLTVQYQLTQRQEADRRKENAETDTANPRPTDHV